MCADTIINLAYKDLKWSNLIVIIYTRWRYKLYVRMCDLHVDLTRPRTKWKFKANQIKYGHNCHKHCFPTCKAQVLLSMEYTIFYTRYWTHIVASMVWKLQLDNITHPYLSRKVRWTSVAFPPHTTLPFWTWMVSTGPLRASSENRVGYAKRAVNWGKMTFLPKRPKAQTSSCICAMGIFYDKQQTRRCLGISKMDKMVAS